MTHLAGHDRSQILLLPEALDDYVGPGNPVRFIEAFVDGLDLAAAGFARVVVAGRGYFRIEDSEACEKAGMVAYVPHPLLR